jgi:hypothetical protein
MYLLIDNMKGVYLSTNTIAILIITIIVLILIIAFFMGIFPGTAVSMKCQAEFRIECERFRDAGCNFANYPRVNELKNASICFIGTDNEDEIKKVCCG